MKEPFLLNSLSFFSLINQEEVFHAGAFFKIPKSNPNYYCPGIISFATFTKFKFSLTGYQLAKIESLQAENNAKLWLFLSQTNMVEVISHKEPSIIFVPENNL